MMLVIGSRIRLGLIGFLGLLFLTAGVCRETSDSGGAPTATVDQAAILTPDYQEYSLGEICEKAANRDPVRVAGVLKAPDSIINRVGNYRVLLVETLEQEQPFLGLWIKVGEESNQIFAVPEEFTLDDFRITKADGIVVTQGNSVVISGKFGLGCEVNVERIE